MPIENKRYECEGCGRRYNSLSDAEQCEKTHDCCIAKNEKKRGFWSGLMYGLLPHTFCILFIVASVLGTTVLASLFKPFLMNRYFFYILIALSFILTTISSLFYLRKNNCLCFSGARKRWKYLTIMYTVTISINLLFFFVVFPAVANISSLSSVTAAAGNSFSDSLLTLNVDIPCSGHAPLISGELKKLTGITDVQYVNGNFEVKYDSSRVSKQQILAIDIFKTYPATIVNENSQANLSGSISNSTSIKTAGTCGAGGGCGGSCCGTVK